MNLVLLSGGSGKRLWPLSNNSRSKQFLKILEDSDGNHISMVQRVYKQIESAKLNNTAVIATSKAQVEMIQSQLGNNIPIVIEPERRDTFPAIALAATFLYSEKKIDLNEVVTVLPVDPYVEDAFFQTVAKLEKVVIESNADMVLMGVKPTYPSTKYGYIVPHNAESENDFLKVSHFKEKPSEDLANSLIKENALWNCGVFSFKLSFIIDIIQELSLPLEYEKLSHYYNQLPKNSFDYEVVEKAKSIAVLPFEGYWKDLGTWNTLTEEMGSNTIGKGRISEDSVNTHLINELDIPIAILGVSDLLVAASPDGILVTEKSASPRLKEMILDFEQRPMYEERRWGWYKVLDFTKYDQETEVLTKRIHILEGKNLSYQIHDKRSEVWTVVMGEGELLLNGKHTRIKTGDTIEIPAGTKHSIKAVTDVEIIEIQRGSELIEDDIIRLEHDWENILEIYAEKNFK